MHACVVSCSVCIQIVYWMSAIYIACVQHSTCPTSYLCACVLSAQQWNSLYIHFFSVAHYNKNVHARMLYSLDHIHNPLWTMCTSNPIHNVSFVYLLDLISFVLACNITVSATVSGFYWTWDTSLIALAVKPTNFNPPTLPRHLINCHVHPALWHHWLG